MKKLASILTAAALAATMGLGLSACTPEESADGVSLRGISGATEITPAAEIDYFVAAEPAVTTRSNATGLNIVGDLQELYGSENGYPQAVIVAKNELVSLNADFVQDFLEEVIANEAWLESASAQTVLDAITANLPAGSTPTFTANNLNAQVIANCGIHFVPAYEDKERVTAFLAEMAEVDPTSVGTVSDNFFNGGDWTTSGGSDEISVYAPDGAPALALAKLMSEDNQFNQTSVDYNIVAANAIQGYITGDNPVADICILPLNAASKLLGSGQAYTMLGTVTNGNLYILSESEEEITAQNIKELLTGKTVGVIQLAQVPGLTFKIILDKYGIPYETIG